MMTTDITVRFKREALHYWAHAPDSVGFLRHPHRHEFHVAVTIRVEHDDRELEFFLFRNECAALCTIPRGLDAPAVPKSCEAFAKELIAPLIKLYNRPLTVVVSEDGENAATVTFTPTQQ